MRLSSLETCRNCDQFFISFHHYKFFISFIAISYSYETYKKPIPMKLIKKVMTLTLKKIITMKLIKKSYDDDTK